MKLGEGIEEYWQEIAQRSIDRMHAKFSEQILHLQENHHEQVNWKKEMGERGSSVSI